MTLTQKTKPEPAPTTLTSVELDSKLYAEAKPVMKRTGFSLREITESGLRDLIDLDQAAALVVKVKARKRKAGRA